MQGNDRPVEGGAPREQRRQGSQRNQREGGQPQAEGQPQGEGQPQPEGQQLRQRRQASGGQPQAEGQPQTEAQQPRQRRQGQGGQPQAEGQPQAASQQPRQRQQGQGGRQGGGQAQGRQATARAEAPPQPSGPAAPKVPRLLTRYREEIAPKLMSDFQYRVLLQAPRLEKVVLNVGLGEAITNANVIDAATQMLATIAGQKPVVTKAKKSIATFKIREGMRIGAMVTLRSRRMYEFMDRLLNASLPRIRDFQGVSRSAFDGRGNYSLSIREQVIFPEIDYSKIDRIRGFQITIVTTAKSDREAFRLLELMGMPFAKA